MKEKCEPTQEGLFGKYRQVSMVATRRQESDIVLFELRQSPILFSLSINNILEEHISLSSSRKNIERNTNNHLNHVSLREEQPG